MDSQVFLLLKHILYNRGFDEIEVSQYLNDHFEPNIFIPSINDKTFLNFLKIIEKSNKILLIGDYDADGVISTSILNIALKALSKDVDFYLPNRYTDGYGLNINTLKSINTKYKLKNYDLIITIDNGISSTKEIEYLVNNGLGVVVIDHHILPENLPKANLIIHPFITDLKYKYLCASGIAYKVASFLLNYTKDNTKYDLERDILYLAGIGTLADVVPLLDENRRIAKKMLNLSKENNYMPFVLKKLWEKIGYKSFPLSSFDFSFILIPRINAPGRISSANIIFDFILSNYFNIDENLIIQKIQEIENINKHRQKLQEKLYQKVISNINKNNYHKNEFIIPDYIEDDISYLGVMGIVAGKIANEYNKPCLIFIKVNDTLKGSVRNPIDELNITDVFLSINRAKQDIIKKYGGHSKAAGIEINISKFQEFRNLANLKLVELYQKSNISPNIKRDSKIAINLPFYFFDSFLNNLETINEIMEPYGEKNDKPSLKIPLTNFLIQYLNTSNFSNDKKNLTIKTFKNNEVCINIDNPFIFYKKLKSLENDGNNSNSFLVLKFKSIKNNKYNFDFVDLIQSSYKLKPIILEITNFFSNFIFPNEIFFINVNFKTIQNFINFINSFNNFYIIIDKYYFEQAYEYLKQLENKYYLVDDINEFKKVLFFILNDNITLNELATLYINEKIYKGLLLILITDKAKEFYEFLKNNKEDLNINFNLLFLNAKLFYP
jgi:single-stranded-DNA-specific exonuclease